MLTHARILNKDFEHPSDGWYMIEAKGEHPNPASGVVQVIDNKAAESIVNQFNADADANKLRHGREMLIDQEHWKDDPSKATTAFGWLTQLQDRPDGIYGQIRWTATGKPAVDGGDYRFFSTEYLNRDVQILNNSKPRRVRPLRLDGLTLTNMNNNRGQTPITNRVDAAPADDAHRSEYEDGYPKPALEAWFKAVGSMQKGIAGARGHTALQPSFKQAWMLCKNQHPELYIAAFGSLSADPYADPADEQEPDEDDSKDAAVNIADITNRIKTESGWTFQESWNFARSIAPRLFNRAARSPGRVTTGKPLNLQTDAQQVENEDRQRASMYFQKLVNQERPNCRSYDEAYQRVRNRETALHSLACGKLTGAVVFAARPDLFKQVYG